MLPGIRNGNYAHRLRDAGQRRGEWSPARVRCLRPDSGESSWREGKEGGGRRTRPRTHAHWLTPTPTPTPVAFQAVVRSDVYDFGAGCVCCSTVLGLALPVGRARGAHGASRSCLKRDVLPALVHYGRYMLQKTVNQPLCFGIRIPLYPAPRYGLCPTSTRLCGALCCLYEPG